MKTPVIRIAYGAAFLLAVVYAILTLRGPYGVSAYIRNQQEIREREAENAELARENQLRREYIERLKQNQLDQEMEIRRRLKLVKPKEKVFIKGAAE
jgi:cell division protein FtsB